MNTPPPQRPAVAAPLRATAITNSHATSKANAQPNTTNKAKNVSPQPNTTSKASNISQPSTTSKASNISQPSTTNKANNVAPASTTNKANNVAQATATIKAKNVSQPSTTNKANTVSKPNTNKANNVSPPKITNKANNVSPPKTTNKANNVSQPPQVHTTKDHAQHVHHRAPAPASAPAPAGQSAKPNQNQNQNRAQNGQSAQNSHTAPPPPPIILPPPSNPTPLVAPYTPSSMLLAPGPPPAPSSDIGDEDALELNAGPISPHSPPIPSVTPTSYLAAPNGTHCSCPHDEVGRVGLLLRTVDFAAWKHQCQRRKDLDQTPYINHPIAVATLLSSTGITNIHVLQAAVLHDTVEDTNTSIDEIERTFGPEVASIVQECTDDTTLNGLERKIEQLRTAPFKSREAQQVKLADKLHNLDSIRRSPPLGWTVQRIQGYFKWAKQVTDVCAEAHPPLAARLQTLYETAYTRVNGEYFPCHPDVCGPLTEVEKSRVDQRFAVCGAGDQPCPHPIFF